MLVLFDIDGTMLLTERAGVASMTEAGQTLFGPTFTFDGIEVAGRLDALIWRDLAARNGIDDTPDNHARFRTLYGERLGHRLRAQPTTRALPGVTALLDRLERESHVTLGLLTGNYPETGRLKIHAAGIDPDRFLVTAWGIDGPSRRDLTPVAMARYAERHGRPVPHERVTVIGDTPHDVDCARHHGCRSLAVATGAFGVDELERHGPTRAVADLSDTEDLASWLLGST